MNHVLKSLMQQARDFIQAINRPNPEDIAQEKRRMERELRAAGRSRTEAMTLVSKHFRNRAQGSPSGRV